MSALEAKALQMLYFKEQQMAQFCTKKYNWPIIEPFLMTQNILTLP